MMPPHEDTIAAIATPVGQAGIGIVRLSGPQAYPIAKNVFRPKRKGQEVLSHRLTFGHVLDPSSGSLIDEVLFSYMKAPRSYTREDVVEINSHSGYTVLAKILQVVTDQGARLARPGEFTLRAFLNGRIDLTQAEAVMDLIHCQSDRGLALASQQLAGAMREEIETLRRGAVEILAHAEVAIDFPEEESDIFSRKEAAHQMEVNLMMPLKALIQAHASKRIWIDGVTTVIAGQVNAGKSSLLNRLLNEPRAIVTPIPGTTRDFIESSLTLGGVPLRLVDTAGFGQVRDEVDQLGIQRTGEKLAEADLVLAVIDRSKAFSDHDHHILHQVEGRRAIVVLNKIDLPSALEEGIKERLQRQFRVVEISALTGEGLESLERAITESVLTKDMDTASSHAVPNLRHTRALSNAFDAFRNSVTLTQGEAPMELVAMELKSGLDALGEIVGETRSEDLIESIFSRFCIGK